MKVVKDGGGGEKGSTRATPITRHTRARLFVSPRATRASPTLPLLSLALSPSFLSLFLVMADIVGPSTPSRKRSRWDVEEDNTPPVEKPVQKRRTKSKPPQATETRTPERSATPTGPSQQLSSRARPRHSLFVPPRTAHPHLLPSRSVYCYERLNSIEEGSYGVVFRARDKETGDIVALKKLKLDEEKYGFPITSLREINALIACKHDNVVGIREIVVGETLTQCVRRCFVSFRNKKASHRLACWNCGPA